VASGFSMLFRRWCLIRPAFHMPELAMITFGGVA